MNKNVALYNEMIAFFAGDARRCQHFIKVASLAKQLAESEAADAELGSAIHFTKIDVDELPDIAADFDIMSIPTIVILENGEEITRLTGAMSAEEFISQLKSIAG